MVAVIRRLAVVGIVLALTGTSWAATLSESEAHQLLLQAQKTRPEPGCYRSVTTSGDNRRIKKTTTTLTRYDDTGKKVSRTETLQVEQRHPDRVFTRIRIRNDEGVWMIYGKKAVLMPKLIDRDKILEIARQGLEQPNDPASPPKAEGDGTTQRMMEMGVRLAQHMKYTGETFDDNGRHRARIVRTFDPEDLKALKKLADEMIAAAKKQLSFGMRLAVNAVMLTKDTADFLPAREEYVVDTDSVKLVETRAFNRTGKLIRSDIVETPERIPDLPPEMFRLPPDAERLRPATFAEAIELMQKLEKKTRASKGKAVSEDDED